MEGIESCHREVPRKLAMAGEYVELPSRSWTHYSVGVASREEAIEEMYSTYEAHPGRRRKPPREAFEVVRVRQTPFAWIIYVRVKRRG